jgi:inosine-uridine nucleoside N-ribohydrolase
LCLGSLASWAQAAREKIIIDTDIGDDVDDAFALALAVKSPEFEILGVTTTFRDTELRAKIVDRSSENWGNPRFP